MTRAPASRRQFQGIGILLVSRLSKRCHRRETYRQEEQGEIDTAMLAFLLLSVVLVLVFRILVVWRQIQWARRTGKTSAWKTQPPVKTLLVLGSGGHTTELLGQTQHLRSFYEKWYVMGHSDSTSRARLPSNVPKDRIHIIPRARHVGQSYVSSLWTTLVALLYSFTLVWRLQPDLILCNGPGTCVPLVASALVLRICGFRKIQVVFSESYCRVSTLSLTGRILYLWVDVFMVHWPALQVQYPESILSHSFVVHQSADGDTSDKSRN